jgi:HEAT repeat protein/protein-S-isoprenylcysteine O-methyltransferase Ste14
MESKLPQNIFIAVLAVIFTIGLTFASLELPGLLDSFLQKSFSFPGFDQGLSELNLSKTELYIRHFHIRTIGYICLLLIVGLIVVGFITNKTGWSSIGAIALFIPAFGSFALSMFFLAGLGFLRLLWMPFTDISPVVMKLGHIVYIPYDLFMAIGSLFNVYPRHIIITICVGTGIFLFLSGTIAWFFTRFRRHNVADFFVYRICRHPQYLGWIIWSYGIFLFQNQHFKKTWTYPDSLPWLLATVVIIGVAKIEELRMKKQFGEEYESFSRRTHFMFPLPRFLKKIIRLPIRFILRIRKVEKKRHVLAIIALYTAILMTASYFYVNQSKGYIKLSASSKSDRVEELITILKTSDSRRTKSYASMDLVRYGALAVDPLLGLVNDPDPVVRDFSIQALGQLKSEKAISAFMAALNDDDHNVRYDAIAALGELKASAAADTLIILLDDPRGSVRGRAALALAKIGSEKAIDPIIASLDEEEKYTLCSMIDALGKLKAQRAVPRLLVLLKHDEPMVRQAAAVALANIRSPDAKDALTEALNDEDWQVRIYAAEALKMIKNP